MLLASFMAFLAIAIGGPMWLRHFVLTATVDQEASVESKGGTLSISSGDEMRTLDASAPPRRVAEGWVIETLPGARAFIDFSERHGDTQRLGPTVNLEPGTVLRLDTVRRPRFAIGRAPRQIELAAQPSLAGAAGLEVGTTWDAARLAITTPNGRVELAPESSARLMFIGPRGGGEGVGESISTTVRLRVIGVEGTVTVTNAGGQIALEPDQRTDVTFGQAPSAPTSGPENVVENSRFREPPESAGWEFGRYPDAQPVPGEANHEILRGGRSAVHFRRTGSHGTSADLYFRQNLDVEVDRARAISVTAEVRVREQSIPGGGAAGTEYPLIIRLRTESQSGEQCEWPVGFFAVAPEPESGYRTDNGLQVPLGEWYTFASGDLLDPDNPLAFVNRLDCAPRLPPARLMRIEIRASGHDYDSEIDGVEVWMAPK